MITVILRSIQRSVQTHSVYRVATIINHKTQRLCANKDFLIDMFVQYVTGRNQGQENHFKLYLAKLHANRNAVVQQYSQATNF